MDRSVKNHMVVIGTLFVAAPTIPPCCGLRLQEGLAQEVSSATRAELDASNRVRPIYAEILSRIRGDLQAHVTEAGASGITLDLPALPENLYGNPYRGTVIFGDIAVWTFEVFAPRPADPHSPPALTLRFDEPTEPQEGPRLIFSLHASEGEVAVIDTNGVVPSLAPLPTAIPERDPGAAIARLSQSIVRGQLLSGSSPR